MAYTRLNPTHVQSVVDTVTLKRPDTQVTLKGINVNGIHVLYASPTCASGSAGGESYLEFQTGGRPSMVTFGVWSLSDGSKSGVISVEGNNNAWLKGASSSILSGKKVYIQIVMIPMPT